MQTLYDKTKAHKTHQEVVEKLGKVLWYEPKEKQIIVSSPSRGLIGYNAKTKQFFEVLPEDQRIKHYNKEEKESHFNFGQIDMLLTFMKNEGYTEILRKTFPKENDFERAICNITYSILRYGSKIKCSDFIEATILSHYIKNITLESLERQELYYKTLSEDKTKENYFKTYTKVQKKKQGKTYATTCLIKSREIETKTKETKNLNIILEEKTKQIIWFEITNTIEIESLKQKVSKKLGLTIKELKQTENQELKEIENYSKGQILSTIINTTIYKDLEDKAKEKNISISYLFGNLSTYMASIRNKDKKLILDIPSSKVKDIYKKFKITDSNSQKLEDYLQKQGLK